MVECSPASERDSRSRAARVRFPADAAFFFSSLSSPLAKCHGADDDGSDKISEKRRKRYPVLIEWEKEEEEEEEKKKRDRRRQLGHAKVRERDRLSK